ncbi:MAG: LysR family transcriptional regulator, partial [Pseudomonadota bacterium]|nr:LysR family transcriptional regulator [Pseudomonadota bacterium]
MAVTLRQLRYLRALADTLHFGRAAEACSVTQPALSMQIKELENALAAPLVERRRASVQLTEVGREVVRRAGRILLDVQDLEAVSGTGRGPLGRRLSLGVIPTVAPYFLPVALPRLQAQFPELELRLQEAKTERLSEEVAKGELDAALLALPVSNDRFGSVQILEDHFLLATPKGTDMPDPARVRDLD